MKFQNVTLDLNSATISKDPDLRNVLSISEQKTAKLVTSQALMFLQWMIKPVASRLPHLAVGVIT